jgi:small subunit ribosomal protein S3
MVLRWLVQKVLKMEEFFINFQSRYCYALAEAHTTYGRMGIKVWIMKVRFTERDLSPLAGMDKKQAGGKGGDLLVKSTLIKVENQTLVRKFLN